MFDMELNIFTFIIHISALNYLLVLLTVTILKIIDNVFNNKYMSVAFTWLSLFFLHTCINACLFIKVSVTQIEEVVALAVVVLRVKWFFGNMEGRWSGIIEQQWIKRS